MELKGACLLSLSNRDKEREREEQGKGPHAQEREQGKIIRGYFGRVPGVCMRIPTSFAAFFLSNLGDSIVLAHNSTRDQQQEQTSPDLSQTASRLSRRTQRSFSSVVEHHRALQHHISEIIF